jgi:hypothetical protein
MRLIRELFIEIHFGRIMTEGFDERAIISWLAERGYHLVWSESLPKETQNHFVIRAG